MRKLWANGMRSNALRLCLQDSAVVVLVFLFGLRKSSVIGIRQDDIRTLINRRCKVLMRVWKGRESHEAVGGGAKVYDILESIY